MIIIIRKQLILLPLPLLWFGFHDGFTFYSASSRLLYRIHHVCMSKMGICKGMVHCRDSILQWDSDDEPTHLPDEPVLQSNKTSSFLLWCLLWGGKGGRRGDPFVPRWDTLSNTPVLNKHTQTPDQLTPAAGIPLVCLDDGRLLLTFAPALSWKANGKAGYGGELHIDSPTCIVISAGPE